MQCFYWPGMDSNIASHLKSCHRCQLRRRDDRPTPTLLSPLPLPTEPGQRVHADLFGPLKTSDKGKKFILCVTDAFTKYVELVALPNKEAVTVAEAIFDKWICRFGTPLDLVTDQGTEFCAKLSNELFTRLGMAHLTTSSHHPQCNSQAEVANKTIAKYLSSFCDDSTLDWELYLAPLMFISMLMNILYYGVAAEIKSEGLQIGPIKITAEQVMIGVLSNLITFPPTFIIVQLFRRSRAR